ncbi:MAG: DNA repair protein RecN [Candidatus Planktophila sp.]|nr:DNA repair protein RecN [Candidatus Planktophila sp.]
MSDRTFLDEITIRSIGVIDQATLEISKGLTVLTGETGAGKTMILTALNLILGGKSDSALVRKGSERLVASGKFSIPADQIGVFENCGVVVEDSALIITRSVSADGKSKATCNGISVTTNTLSSMSELIVEVHAQAANINISKTSKQRDLLDKFAGGEFEVTFAEYSKVLTQYHALKTRITALRKSIERADQELKTLREFVLALTTLKLKHGEYPEINSDIDRLSSVEELRIAGASALSAIDGDEVGALTSVGVARRALESARSKDAALEAIYAQLSEGFYLIEDAGGALASYLASLEADPHQLDYLQARRAEIHALVKKFGGSNEIASEADGLLARYKSSENEIADLEGGDNRLKEMETELVGIKKQLVIAAKSLSEVRKLAGEKLSSAVTVEMQALSMPHAAFYVKIESVDYAALKESGFTAFGCDEVSMFISAHQDAPLVSIAKGASGGEMSRVMLALEVVIAATHPVGTYIFDEVDAGVGGKAAIEVGRRLHSLSRHAQVVVVTHLPQVAAWADSHFVVTKDSNGSVGQSDVRRVVGADRIEELARMLAGLENSVSAREHATELLSLKMD